MEEKGRTRCEELGLTHEHCRMLRPNVRVHDCEACVVRAWFPEGVGLS